MPKAFRRDLIVLFVGKLIILAGLFLICFSPKTRPQIDPLQVSNKIFNSKEMIHDARS